MLFVIGERGVEIRENESRVAERPPSPLVAAAAAALTLIVSSDIPTVE